MYNNFLSQPQQKERKKVNSLKIYSHVPENQYKRFFYNKENNILQKEYSEDK
jgi:hypothetical protein